MAAIRPGPRIEGLLDVLGSVGVLADIGTDHGLLPVAAVLRGQAQRAVATDLRPGPLEAARQQVARAGLDHRVELRHGWGLEPLRPGEADAIVIAGLHGETIAAILHRGAARLVPGTRLVLQPSRGAAALRLPAWDGDGRRLWPAPARGASEGAAAGSRGCGPLAAAPGGSRPPSPGAGGAQGARGDASGGPSGDPSGRCSSEGTSSEGCLSAGCSEGTPSQGTGTAVEGTGPKAAPALWVALEGERLVQDGRHTYPIMAGRVVEPAAVALAVRAPAAAVASARGPEPMFGPADGGEPGLTGSGPGAAAARRAPAPGFAISDEPAFIWVWGRPVAEAAQRLAHLASACGVDPRAAVASVGPALLARRADGGPDPLLAAWLDELARPWRRALMANAGSTPRARAARRQAAAWLKFLGQVLARTAGNHGGEQGTEPRAGPAVPGVTRDARAGRQEDEG
ncbi:tRNA (adenine(22)-N(1))-methyltransferase [Thermaerobacter litoralis]